MVHHAPFAFYPRDPTTAAQPPKQAAYVFAYSAPPMPSLLPQLDAMRPGRVASGPPPSSIAFPYPTSSSSNSSSSNSSSSNSSGASSPGYDSPAACMPLEWPSPEMLSPSAASTASPSASSTLSAASSPAGSPSPPPLSLSGQPVLSDDQLLQEMFQRSASVARRFPSLSMDDAVLCGQMLGLPSSAGFHPHGLHHSSSSSSSSSSNPSAGGSFLSLRGLAVPPSLAIPSPMGYNRAFSSPPMLSSANRHGSLAAAGLTKKKVPASRICRMSGCTKGIRSRGLCKAHGGGRRCQTPGCEISDQGGGHCIAHGGGRRCSVAGCLKSAQSKGLCKLHGGARLCRLPSCSKNGQIKGLCRLHYSLMMAGAGHGAGASSASAAGRRG